MPQQIRISAERQQIWTTELPYAYGPAANEKYVCWKKLTVASENRLLLHETREK